MRIHKIVGDGNCLFGSCAFYLGINSYQLRQRVVAFIRENPHFIINGTCLTEWFRMVNHDPMKYADSIEKNGTFGTGLDLMIISIAYQRSICVMKKGKCKKCKSQCFEQIDHYFKELGKTMYLYFSGSPQSGHYDVLLED